MMSSISIFRPVHPQINSGLAAGWTMEYLPLALGIRSNASLPRAPRHGCLLVFLLSCLSLDNKLEPRIKGLFILYQLATL